MLNFFKKLPIRAIEVFICCGMEAAMSTCMDVFLKSTFRNTSAEKIKKHYLAKQVLAIKNLDIRKL